MKDIVGVILAAVIAVGVFPFIVFSILIIISIIQVTSG